VALNLLSLSPFLRGPRTVARTVNSARRGETFAKVVQAARPRPNYWQGSQRFAVELRTGEGVDLHYRFAGLAPAAKAKA
jgi:hypothetical protein